MSVIDDAALNRISFEARQILFWRTVLLVLARLFWGVGFVTARAFGLLWLALAWVFTAVQVGWREGRKPYQRPRA